jgi:GTP-binding protein
MGKKKVSEVVAGDLCAVVGLEGFNIGDTVADAENPKPWLLSAWTSRQ